MAEPPSTGTVQAEPMVVSSRGANPATMNRGLFGIALLLSVPVALGVLAAVHVTTGRFRFATLWGAVAFVAIFLLVYVGGSHGSVETGDVVTGVGDSPEATEDSQESEAGSEEAVGIRRATPVDVAMGAGLGALVTVLVWYIPGSPLLGGLAAGYMANGDRDDAQRAALLAGLLVPLVVLGVASVAFVMAGAQVIGRFPFGPRVALGVAVASLFYVVGFSVAGGRISARIRHG